MNKINSPTKGAALRLMTLTAALTLAACSSSDDSTNAAPDPDTSTQITYVVDLESSQEVPPVAGNAASGTANIVLDTATGALSGQLDVENLSGAAVAARVQLSSWHAAAWHNI